MARLPPSMRGKPLDWGDDELATRVQRDAAALCLIAREGPAAGEIFGSDGHAITIGRGSGCAVRLALSEISRRHALVRYHAGRYWVEDLGTLNGTKVNDQLIDGPTALKQGDRVTVGAQTFEVRFGAIPNRQVVHDGQHSAPVNVTQTSSSRDPRTPAPMRLPIAPLGPLGFAAVGVLAVATGVVLAFAITRQSRHRTDAVTPAPRPAASVAVTPPPPSPPLVVQTRIEVDSAEALATHEAGSVQWSAARGTPVRAGDELLRIRHNNAAKQRELDRVNEQLEEDDSNPQLVRRARALAEELADDHGTTNIKSDFDGIVVASLAPGTHLPPTGAEVRVAHAVRLIVDATAVHGTGSSCHVAFLDQHLESDGRRVVGGAGATIELTRFAERLSFERVGQVRVDCK